MILRPRRPEPVARSAQHGVGAAGEDRRRVGLDALCIVELHLPAASLGDRRDHPAIHHRIGTRLVGWTQLIGYVDGKSGGNARRYTDVIAPGKAAASASND